MTELSKTDIMLLERVARGPVSFTHAPTVRGTHTKLVRSSVSPKQQAPLRDLAMRGFRQYLESFPSTALAANATYWIGECHYRQKRFRQAIEQYDAVLNRYPRSDKTASALLKKGYAHLELGERSQGVVQLQHVLRQFPTSDEANLARQRLREIGVDGR